MKDILLEIAKCVANSNCELPVVAKNKRQSSAEAEQVIISYIQNQNRWDVTNFDFYMGNSSF